MSLNGEKILSEGAFSFSNVPGLFRCGKRISFEGTFDGKVETLFEVGKCYNFYIDDHNYYKLLCMEALEDGSFNFKFEE